VRHIRRLLARKMGVADNRPVPRRCLSRRSRATVTPPSTVREVVELLRKRLDASKSQEEARRALKSGKRRTSTMRRNRKWRAAAPGEDDRQQMEGVLTSDFADLIGFEFTFGSDTIGVKLICDVKPYSSNGKWDEKGAVKWSRPSVENDARGRLLCPLEHPDRPSRRSTSQGLAERPSLASTSLWYRSPGRDEAGGVDVLRLQPGPGTESGRRGFRSGRSQADPNPKEALRAADTPRQLILATFLDAPPEVTRVAGPPFLRRIDVGGRSCDSLKVLRRRFSSAVQVRKNLRRSW